VKKTTVIGVTGAFLVGVGSAVYFIVGLGCSFSQYALGICISNGQSDISSPIFLVGLLLMGIGLVLFFAVYEYEYAHKWEWWRNS
jgi:hypothetical protein